ncbi:MAG TPA: hexitol phosphatase HxpB [Candidatus Saccharimonadales bacterium]|nr:hexitol phosphatase HxpB [Candidatus Saccharimonadales bacterium]
MIKAAIFDMDGLLVDSEPLWQRVNRDVYKKLGVELTAADHQMMIGQRTNENVEYLYQLYQWKGPTPQQVEKQVVDEMVRLIRASEAAMLPGVHHALQVCKQAGLPVAIASSSDQAIIDAVVDTLELRDHFNHIYSAQFEEYGKPHPGVFLKVAKHFKVLPQQCLVFEDSPSGVLAAKAARMICVAVPHPANREHPFIKIADAELGSLEEFDAALLRRLGEPGV